MIKKIYIGDIGYDCIMEVSSNGIVDIFYGGTEENRKAKNLQKCGNIVAYPFDKDAYSIEFWKGEYTDKKLKIDGNGKALTVS